ncbi:hypothetical protein D3C85_1030270 [compost metagenome]
MPSYCQVKSFTDNIHQPVRQDFHNLHLGVARKKHRKQIAQRELCDFDGGGDANYPAGFGQPLPHGLFGDVRAMQHGNGVLVKLGANVGHAELSRRAVNQPHTQIRLQFLNPVAEC